MAKDNGEMRIGVWGVDGHFAAMLRTRAPGEKDLTIRAVERGFKTAEKAEAAMRAKLKKGAR